MAINPSINRVVEKASDDLAWKVENSVSYDSLFSLVKQVVERRTGMHRAGLSLILSDMPNVVGAYHPVGSNVIVLNRALVEDMKRFLRKEDVNSFIFTVLMHEYLHSLGLYDESAVRLSVQKIVCNALGENHITVRMAAGNWLEMYPQLALNREIRYSQTHEVVKRFDSGSSTYLG